MNALFVLGFLAAIIYGILIDGTFFKIYFSILLVYTIVFNNFLVDKSHTTKRKNIAITTWSAPSDPTAYLPVDYDVTNALQYLKKINEQSDVKITLTHIVVKGLAVAMFKMRRDIGRIKWGYFQRAKKIGVSVVIDVDEGADLVPMTLWDAHNCSYVEIAKKIIEIAQLSRAKKNKEHNESTKLFTLLPPYLLDLLTVVCTYLSQNAGIGIGFLGLKANAFGHCVLTNVGTLGIEYAYAPVASPCHLNFIQSMGKVSKRPVVVDDQLVIRDVMTCIYSFDHRFGDGALITQFTNILKDILENPETFNPDKYQELESYEDMKKRKQQ